MATPGLAVVVTGAAGRIGRAVAAELLARGHRVRGFDRVPSPGLADQVQGDLARPGDVARAVAGADAVVHLAATPDEDDFLTRLLPDNVVGLYHLLEQARLAGVRRVVLASSGQVVRGHAGPVPITPEMPVAPRNWYAATKVLAEAAGQAYAHLHGLSVIVVRCGWCPRTRRDIADLEATDRGRNVYLSTGDAGRCFAGGAGRPPVRCGVRHQPAAGADALRPRPRPDAPRLRAPRPLAGGHRADHRALRDRRHRRPPRGCVRGPLTASRPPRAAPESWRSPPAADP